MKIGFLGTGSSSSRGKRLNTSLIFSTPQGNLLVDCSGSPEVALAKQGISILKVSNILLTHGHIDHVYALPSFIHSQRMLSLPNSSPPLNIFGLPKTLEIVTQLIEPFQLLQKDPPTSINWIPLHPPGKIKILDLTVEFFPVQHGHYPSIGILLTNSQEKSPVLYSGDTEVCDNILTRIRKNTTLIHECCGLNDQPNHTSAYQLRDSLMNKPPGEIVLVHLPDLTAQEESLIQSLFHPIARIRLPQDNDSCNL